MVRLIALTAMACVVCGLLAFAQERVPLATDLERAIAAFDFALDGRGVTVRASADDAVRVCIAPATGRFGPTRCFTAGQVRRGEVVAK